MEENEKSRSATVIKDADGNSIVMINDIRFKGKRSINWDEVKKYIEEFVGDDYTIAETSDVVYIGADLPDEYTGSKYTESLRGANAKAKANASQGIPELLSIAKGKYFRENNARKHKKMQSLGGIVMIRDLRFLYMGMIMK